MVSKSTEVVKLTKAEQALEVLGDREIDPKKPEVVKAIGWAQKEVGKLVQRLDVDFFNLAQLLHVVHKHKLFKFWQFPTWADYVHDTFTFSKSTASHLEKMWGVFGERLAEFPEIMEAVKPLGWTKAYYLADVVDQHNHEEWVEKAENASVEKLKRMIKAAKKGENPDDTPDTTTRTFAFVDDQYEVVKAALEEAGKVAESDKKGHILTLICTEYLNVNVFGSDPDADRAEVLRRTGELLGVDLVAMRKGDVILDTTGGDDDE